MRCEKMHRFRLSTGERETETDTHRNRERHTQRQRERTNERKYFINEGDGISTIFFYIQPSGEREREGVREKGQYGEKEGD